MHLNMFLDVHFQGYARCSWIAESNKVNDLNVFLKYSWIINVDWILYSYKWDDTHGAKMALLYFRWAMVQIKCTFVQSDHAVRTSQVDYIWCVWIPSTETNRERPEGYRLLLIFPIFLYIFANVLPSIVFYKFIWSVLGKGLTEVWVRICHTYEYVSNVLHMRTFVRIRNILLRMRTTAPTQESFWNLQNKKWDGRLCGRQGVSASSKWLTQVLYEWFSLSFFQSSHPKCTFLSISTAEWFKLNSLTNSGMIARKEHFKNRHDV